MEEKAATASAEGRIRAKEGGKGEEAPTAEAGSIQKWRE